MPEYIPPTQEEKSEIISVLNRIQDKEKRLASLTEVAKSSKLGFSKGRSVINKLIKQGVLRTEFVDRVEYIHQNHYPKKK